MDFEFDFNTMIFLLMVGLQQGTRNEASAGAGGGQTLWLCQLQLAGGRDGRRQRDPAADTQRVSAAAATKEGDETRGVAGTQRAASLERHQSAFCPQPQTLQRCGPMHCAQLVQMHTNVNMHKAQSRIPCFEEACASTGLDPKTAFNRPLPVERHSPSRAAINILCGCVPVQRTYSVCAGVMCHVSEADMPCWCLQLLVWQRRSVWQDPFVVFCYFMIDSPSRLRQSQLDTDFLFFSMLLVVEKRKELQFIG